MSKTLNFEDHFSKHARQYAQYHPKYPDEIYAYLASILLGQEAIGLAKYLIVQFCQNNRE